MSKVLDHLQSQLAAYNCPPYKFGLHHSRTDQWLICFDRLTNLLDHLVDRSHTVDLPMLVRVSLLLARSIAEFN